MPNHSRQGRRDAVANAGIGRADAVARRLGVGLREGRARTSMSQAEAGEHGGISRSMFGRLERGLGATASLQTWALAAAAVGEQLVGFLEAMPGASVPRDIEHLRRQELVVSVAAAGGWIARPEAQVVAPIGRPRSIDVMLERVIRRELGIVEVWDFLDDVGAALRSLDEKRLLVEARSEGAHVGALWIVRGTHRNRALVAALPALFDARFPASSRAWLAALEDPGARMPNEPGLVWTDVSGTRLIAWHRQRRGDGPRRRT